MNPNRGGEQPLPQFEVPATPQEQYGNPAETVAEKPKSPESSPSSQIVPPPMPAPAVQPTDNTSTVAVTVPDDNSVTPATGAAASEHGDRIEKIWVDRAKAIIAQTKDDPFTQKNEMSKVKAEYIAKRFNKKLKLDDAVT